MIELIVRWEDKILEDTLLFNDDEYEKARGKMEDLIFRNLSVESVVLFVPGESLTEMRWSYTSEDGTHVTEFSAYDENHPSLWGEDWRDDLEGMHYKEDEEPTFQDNLHDWIVNPIQ